VSLADITLCVAFQQVFIVYFVIDSVWKLLDTPSYLKNYPEKSQYVERNIIKQ